MTRLKSTLLIIFCISISCYGWSQDKKDLDDINSQIWQTFSDAFATLDIDAFAGIHHPDFIRISGESKQIKDKVEYIKGYALRWAKAQTAQHIDFRFLERINDGNTASERGIYKLSIKPGTPDEKHYYGKFHVVLKKISGHWYLYVDYDSTELGTIDEQAYNSAYAKTEYEKY